MKLSRVPARPSRFVLIFLLLIGSSVSVMCQTPAPTLPRESALPATGRTTADETFELNITERQFTKENFEVSTAVGTDGERGLNLQVGVGLAAGRIDVLLRNVRGSVRFRGTLERILEVLNAKRANSPPAPK